MEQALQLLRRCAIKAAPNRYVQVIVAATKEVIEKAVLQTHLATQLQKEWTNEYAEAIAEAKRLKRLHSQHTTEETWEAYCNGLSPESHD